MAGNEFDILLELVRNDFQWADNFVLADCNARDLLSCINNHKLASILHYKLNDEKGGLRAEIAEFHENAALMAGRMEQTIAEIAKEAKQQKIQFAVIKGLSLNKCIYGQRIMRECGDIDLLIREEDADALHSILLNQGFAQKHGQTSFGVLSDSYSVAALAANAGKVIFSNNLRPIRTHPGKKQYDPYVRSHTPTVEVHYGFHCLEDADTVFLKHSHHGDSPHGLTELNDEINFIILLINTFENSESFPSNSYDFSATIRDYVDLRYFFERYKDSQCWSKIHALIDSLGIAHIAAVCLGNLRDIYSRDVTFGCLPGIEPEESEWGCSVIDRMKSPSWARSQSLRVMRKRFRENATSSILCIPVRESTNTKRHLSRDANFSDILFGIEHTNDGFILTWLIPSEYAQKGDDYLYQFRFIPLSDSMPYTFYKVDLSVYDEGFAVYGHSTKRYFSGTFKKQTNHDLTRTIVGREGCRLITAEISYGELGLSGHPRKNELCLSFEVYSKYHGNTYHRVGCAEIGYECMLLEFGE